MKTKSIPAIIMLLAGLVACIAGMAAHMEASDFLKMLLIVLILFYIAGSVVKVILDHNFAEMQEEETTDGEAQQDGEDAGDAADEKETADAVNEEE